MLLVGGALVAVHHVHAPSDEQRGRGGHAERDETLPRAETVTRVLAPAVVHGVAYLTFLPDRPSFLPHMDRDKNP